MTFHSGAHYVYLLKEHTTLTLPPEKVYETGLQEVKRIEKKIIELLKQQGRWDREVSIGAHLKQLNKPRFITERELFLILDRAEKKLGPLFPTKPKKPPKIQLGSYPGAKWGVGYQPPDTNGSGLGIIHVNNAADQHILVPCSSNNKGQLASGFLLLFFFLSSLVEIISFCYLTING